MRTPSAQAEPADEVTRGQQPLAASPLLADAVPATTADAEAVVLQYYEAVDAGRADAVVELFAPDAVYHRPGYQPMVGSEALQRFYSGQRVIAHGHHTITRMMAVGPTQVAVEGWFTGQLKDGTDVELGFADFFTLCRTLIAQRTTYFAVTAV